MAQSLEYQKEHINDTRVPMIMTSIIAWFIIAYVAVALRFISRRISRTALKGDDWCILGSLVSLAQLCQSIHLLIFKGFHHHILCAYTSIDTPRLRETRDID